MLPGPKVSFASSRWGTEPEGRVVDFPFALVVGGNYSPCGKPSSMGKERSLSSASYHTHPCYLAIPTHPSLLSRKLNLKCYNQNLWLI